MAQAPTPIATSHSIQIWTQLPSAILAPPNPEGSEPVSSTVWPGEPGQRQDVEPRLHPLPRLQPGRASRELNWFHSGWVQHGRSHPPPNPTPQSPPGG